MNGHIGMNKNKLIIGIIIITFILCICSCRQEEKADDESFNQEIMEEVSEKSAIVEATREVSALESFGNFYGRLLEEGRLEELKPYIISRPLSQDEVIALGEYETLSYFKELGVGKYNARIVTVLEVDFDGDGKKDILECDLDNCIPGLPDTNSLTLYRMEGGDFTMMYSQPRFDRIGSSHADEVLVVRYGGEVFLLCRTGSQVTSSETGIYWFRDWEPVGKCCVSSIWQSVKVEDKVDDSFSNRKYMYEILIEDVSAEAGYEDCAEKICKDAPIIASEGGSPIVNVYEAHFVEKQDTLGGYFWGSAEECLTEQVIKKEADGEINAFVERYAGNSGITRETDAETLSRFWAWNGQMFQSDINNDGIMEMYVKRAGTSQLYDTSKQYDASGLGYYMESGGRKTDLMDMCGLDIWEGELIPRMFWVEEADGRNITFLVYQSADRWSFEIVGYDIDGGKYTEILKVGGHALVECTYEYEWKEEGKTEGLPYGVRMAYDDIEHVVLYGMEDREKQERINRAIEEWLRNEIENGRLQGNYADRREPAHYVLYRATEDELVVRYKYIWCDEAGDEWYSKTCGFLVNMDNESCAETNSVGLEDFEDNLW